MKILVLLVVLLVSACGPKCLKESCQVVDTTCYRWVGTVGTNPIYMWVPCRENRCVCVEREVEVEK